MAAMNELESLLQSLQALKAPGVTPTKVKTITAICVENIQSDSTIIQKILQQFQNSPATHKLGVLYVVDSVTRQWVEKAKAAGQSVSRNAPPGTYAAGVQRMTEVLPAVMNDLVQHAPDNQKEKIIKLLDIWQRGQTFPLDMLAAFKQQVNGGQQSAQPAPTSPPMGNGSGPARHAQTNTQQTAAPFPSTAQKPQDPGALLAAFSGYGQQPGQTNASPPGLPSLQSMVPPPPPPGFVPPPPPAANVQPAMPPPPPAGMNDLANQILQAMSAGSIAPDQAIQVLNALAVAQNGGTSLPPAQALVVPQAQAQPQVAVQNGGPMRFEQNDMKMRDRSRSPDYTRRASPSRRSPPNRRESPVYGSYDPNAVGDGSSSSRNERGRGRGKARGGRNDRNEYRQRTPPGQRRQPSPPKNVYGQSRYIEWDQSLPRDNIRVLSRTLFVGGAGGTEGEIRAIFSRFGRVQTCIVNQDKRHAFVKMLTRPDAVAAKEGMDNLQDPAAQSKARQTRWGVGFGPRDCSDYNSGISVIPISRLTDADRKWALTAEHGGTGGRPLEGGMVLEEPDIEIGAGVSSKAISRRVPTDGGRGGRGGFGNSNGNGNGNGHRGGFDNSQAKLRKQEQRPAHDPRHVSPRAEQGVAVPPAVPGFGFQLPGFQAR